MEPVRISKYFTDCGIMSRRAADAAVTAGEVKVNGVTAELGQKVTPGVDRVTWKGKPVVMPRDNRKVYIMLNKPRGYVTTLKDEKGRPTVIELVKDAGTRLYPIGRLDMDSEGLLLMTDDGDFTNLMTHPKHEIQPDVFGVAPPHFLADKFPGSPPESGQIPRDLDGPPCRGKQFQQQRPFPAGKRGMDFLTVHFLHFHCQRGRFPAVIDPQP